MRTGLYLLGQQYFRRFGQDVADPLGGADGFLQLRVEVAHAAHRPADEDRVQDELKQLAFLDGARGQQRGAVPEDAEDAAEQRHDDERSKAAAQAGRLQGRAHHLLQRLVVPFTS
jgi:hypothetical protein